MQPLNYSKQIIESILDNQFEKIIKQQGGISALPELLSLLDKSIKFILPERGEMLQTFDTDPNGVNEFDERWLSLMVLPFPIVAFEIPFPYENDDEILQISGLAKQVQSEKRVALCWNPKHDDEDIKKINKLIHEHDFNRIGGENYLIGDDDSYNGFCMAVFFLDSEKNVWNYAPAGVFFPYEVNQEVTQKGALAVREINLFPFVVNMMMLDVYKFDYERIKQQIWSDINHEAWSVLQACSVLNCENITTRTIDPPLKQQKNRERKGLKPLYSYKVLTIKVDGTKNENIYSVGTGKGSSKRTHFRRGHIRRYADKSVWVKPAMVGLNNVGTVDKEYHIK